MGIRPRIGLMLAVVAAVIFSSGHAAFAKVLPVASIEVVTAVPTAGSPIGMLVRFGENFDLPDAEWENFEVSIVPADQADANGWPFDRDARGTPVPLRRVGKGVYRGSVVEHRPGAYVVFAWSSVYARADRAQGVATTFDYASPVKLFVHAAAPAAKVEARTATRPSASTVPVAFAVIASLLTTGAGLAFITHRARFARKRRCRRVGVMPEA